MGFHFIHAHPGHEVTPRANHARREALFDQIANPLIRRVKIFRSNPAVICFPRITGFIGAPWVERWHVGIKPGDDLDDIEPFLLSISRERTKFVRPTQAMTKPHPPRIPEPEKWSVIEMFQVPPV